MTALVVHRSLPHWPSGSQPSARSPTGSTRWSPASSPPPRYDQVKLTPTPGPGLDWLTAALDTRQGRVECGWARAEDGYTIDVVAPQAASVELTLPDGTSYVVPPGRRSYCYTRRVSATPEPRRSQSVRRCCSDPSRDPLRSQSVPYGYQP